jgi:hypothetical protein
MSTQDELHKFYGARYDTRDVSMDQYELSGYNLAESFNAGDRIIHINCGNNPFKGMVPNFRSQDPTNPNADFVMPLDHYAAVHKTSKFHVALVLGGCDNAAPGSMDATVKDIAQVMMQRDGRIFWRTAINGAYPWSFEEHQRLAALINYSVIAMVMETETEIYAEWNSNVRSITYMDA